MKPWRRRRMSESYYFKGTNSSNLQRKRLRHCLCGIETPLATSWILENPRRIFYGYGLFKIYGKKACKCFDSFDDETSDRTKEVILSLLKKIDEMKKKKNESKIIENDLKMNIKCIEKELEKKYTFDRVIIVLSLVVCNVDGVCKCCNTCYEICCLK
uniref:Uncharacterized protein LOC101491956 n=1 Tax=Cicer arietinum TaxID=3827 RepID=A0A1S2Z2Z4_CICAR|nr:uncharacterized protein LOC101491956 [Cicer arietinum]